MDQRAAVEDLNTASTGRGRSLAVVHAPPADLYKRDPVAFHLWVELAASPRPTLTVADAAKMTGATQAAARRALAELIERGVLERAGGQGYHLPAVAEQPAAPARARACERCGNERPPTARRYCSPACRNATIRAKAIAARAATRAETRRRCVVCGALLPSKARGQHQLYCSRHCEGIIEAQRELERDIAAGTAGVCEHCGGPRRARTLRWCSIECKPRSRGGMRPD